MITIYSDGAATIEYRNGEYIRCAGGWAFAFVENNEIIFSKAGGELQSTNNRMELMAIYMALIEALNLGETEVELHTDSAYCIGIFTNWIEGWKKNGWTRGKKHEPIENLELIQNIDDLIQEMNVKFIKVKGHSGNFVNEYVDKLAVEAKETCAANIKNLRGLRANTRILEDGDFGIGQFSNEIITNK